MRFALGPSLRLLTHHKHPTPPHQVGQVLLDWLQQMEFAPGEKDQVTRSEPTAILLNNYRIRPTASTLAKTDYQKARVGETEWLLMANIWFDARVAG